MTKTKDQTEKRHVIVGVEIDSIKGPIEKNWKFDCQLRVQVHKLKTKNQDKNKTKLYGWWLSLKWVKLSLRGNYEYN
jgi:hypothetical protein